MSGTYYQHVLVAIDLADDNRSVIDKAVERARSNQALLSVIYVDVDLNEIYTELIDIDINNVQAQILAQAKDRLATFLTGIDYPIANQLVSCGDLSERINQAVQLYQIDLLICGHRQSFWSLLASSARQLMNTVPCDLLVVPLPK
jgi:universal stress protein A